MSSLPALPEKVTYYGMPGDSFTRIVDRFRYERDPEGDVRLVINRRVYARIAAFTVNVKVSA